MNRVLFLLFVGTSAFLGGWAAMSVLRSGSPALAEAKGGGNAGDLGRLADRFEVVARRVSPAVVAVEATKVAVSGNTDQTSRTQGTSKKGKNRDRAAPENKVPTLLPPTGDLPVQSLRPIEESGSGVLIKMDGVRETLVLTNSHIITTAPPSRITIALADGRLLHPTKVWSDPESDVALLRLDADKLPTATLGNSDSTRVGQWVLAIGSPFGLNQTVTHGIISARERNQVSLGGTIRIKDFLQTDAAINPGSSGGPLVSLDGEVIGLNTAIASNSGSNSGVAFSIPINLVKRVARQLLDKGEVSRGYLGLQLADSLEPADTARLGLDRSQGALVKTIYPDTPAAAAGLRPDDVVLQLDSMSIRNENDLINTISTLPAGQRIRLQIWRERKRHTVEAVVGDWHARRPDPM